VQIRMNLKGEVISPTQFHFTCNT